MRLITRGLGGGPASGMIVQGMTEVIRIVRGGRSAIKKAYNDFLSEFTIAVKLLEINGKEIFAPIFNKRKYIIDESITHKVNIKNVRMEKRKEVTKTRVIAKILNINRGSDGYN